MNIDEKYRLTGSISQIIECALNIHSFMGNGFQEVICQRELKAELLLKGISFRCKMGMSLRDKKTGQLFNLYNNNY